MNPEPLVGVFANHVLQDAMQRLRIGHRVSAHRDRWIEAQYVALLRLAPQREAGDHGGARMRREAREPGTGARLLAEEIDEDAGGKRLVLVGEDAHGLIRRERLQNRAREVLLADETIAG